MGLSIFFIVLCFLGIVIFLVRFVLMVSVVWWLVWLIWVVVGLIVILIRFSSGIEWLLLV